MNTRRSASALEKPDSTERGPGRYGRPALVTNSYLPPIEELPRKRRSRAHDTLAAADPANDPFDVADLLKEIEDPVDADGRRWPTFPDRPHDPARDFERILADKEAELDKRCAQIADLSHAHKQQEEALLIAREAIESLDQSVTLLQQALTQQERETAAARQDLARCEEDRNALRAQLERTSTELAAWSQRERDASAALDDRAGLIAAARDRIASLEAELAARPAQDAEPPAARTAAGTQSGSDEQGARLGQRIAALEDQLAARDRQIKKLDAIIAKIGARYTRLLESNKLFESEKSQTREILKSQADSITNLAAALRTERDAGDRKIVELAGVLAQEREQHVATERESATFRREIALLLPRLATAARTIQ